MNQDEVLTRGVLEVLPSKAGLSALMSKRKIKLYQGFDPSAPSLHLGNFVGLMKLRQFQKLGHEVIFLVGDFTGMIGDPDKESTRKPLTRKQVLENAKEWKKQAGMLLDFEGSNPAKIVFNSEWNDKISFAELTEIASKVTYAQIIERDMFQKRIKENKDISIHEFLYPIIQGYDSVVLDVDLEIGGNDQLFNMMVGRKLMKVIKSKEKYVLTTKLLVDKEGKKVGKTTGNALFMNSKPNDFYAGIMSFPDEVVALGFELLTEVDLKDVEKEVKENPMREKKRLAFEVVKLLWGEEAANTSQESFEKTFQKKEIPTNIKTVDIGLAKINLLDLVFATKAVTSRSEAKRLIQQRAVEVNGQAISDPNEEVKIDSGITLKIGKTKFIKIVSK